MMPQPVMQPFQMYAYPPNIYSQWTMPSMYATPQFVSNFPSAAKVDSATRAIQTSGNIYVNPPTEAKASLKTVPTQTS